MVIRCDRLRGTAAIVYLTVLLLGNGAAAVEHLDHYWDFTAGPDSIRIAVITDLHDNLQNLEAAVDTINALHGLYPISAVIVTGDLVDCLWTTDTMSGSHLAVIDSCLARLPCPWVPVMGNHDAQICQPVGGWPFAPLEGWEWVGDSGISGMYMTRGFHSWMRAKYCQLESLYADPEGAGPIADFRRYRELPYNFEMHGWPDSFDFDGAAFDAFEQCAFRVGPPGSPYHFLCLDFNSRSWNDIFFLWEWILRLFEIREGPSPRAELFEFAMDDCASSLVVRRADHNDSAVCRLYTETEYGGDCYKFVLREPDTSGYFDLTFQGEDQVKSVRLGYNCDTVWLFKDGFWNSDGVVLTCDDPDLSQNGPVQWWVRELERYDSLATVRGYPHDKLLVFAHNVPCMGVLDVDAGFNPSSDGERLWDLMLPFQNRVGAWFGGHVTPEKFAGLPRRTGSWMNATGSRMCPRYLCRPNGGGDAGGGCVTLVTLRYAEGAWDDPTPLVDASGVMPDPLDATTEDSAVYRIVMADMGADAVMMRGVICDGQAELRCLVADTSLGPGDSAVTPWDCRDSLGVLFLPGSYRSVFTGGGIPMGASYFTVRGARLSGAVSGVLDSFCDPAAITGNVTVPAGDTLIIHPGVRVMPAGDYKVQVYGTLIAGGGEADSERILFTPYRRMKPEPDSCWPGFWKGIEVMPGGRCSLDNCVIEYAGGTPGQDSAAVSWHDAGTVVMTNSVIRQSSTRGVWGGGEDDLAAVLRGETPGLTGAGSGLC